ncbi:hypothetical protein H9P43_006580 [Blastocladiella emersonii ATCC 22665]|nr:hypothetical protein H9P43_006580 [Blastocladiella emersonii ATCC 22665]
MTNTTSSETQDDTPTYRACVAALARSRACGDDLNDDGRRGNSPAGPSPANDVDDMTLLDAAKLLLTNGTSADCIKVATRVAKLSLNGLPEGDHARVVQSRAEITKIEVSSDFPAIPDERDAQAYFKHVATAPKDNPFTKAAMKVDLYRDTVYAKLALQAMLANLVVHWWMVYTFDAVQVVYSTPDPRAIDLLINLYPNMKTVNAHVFGLFAAANRRTHITGGRHFARVVGGYAYDPIEIRVSK